MTDSEVSMVPEPQCKSCGTPMTRYDDFNWVCTAPGCAQVFRPVRGEEVGCFPFKSKTISEHRIELAPDEVMLVSVSNGIMSPESIGRIKAFIDRVRANPDGGPFAMVLEAVPHNPDLPARIEIKKMKCSEIAATDIVIREARDDG